MSAGRRVRIEPFVPTLDPNKRRGRTWWQIAMGGGVYYRHLDDEMRDHADGATTRSYGTIWPTREKAKAAAERLGFRVL